MFEKIHHIFYAINFDVILKCWITDLARFWWTSIYSGVFSRLVKLVNNLIQTKLDDNSAIKVSLNAIPDFWVRKFKYEKRAHQNSIDPLRNWLHLQFQYLSRFLGDNGMFLLFFATDNMSSSIIRVHSSQFLHETEIPGIPNYSEVWEPLKILQHGIYDKISLKVSWDLVNWR